MSLSTSKEDYTEQGGGSMTVKSVTVPIAYT